MDTRSAERVRAHYDLEKKLAARLMAAPKEERLALYAPLYDELFRSLPDHPQNTGKLTKSERAQSVARQVRRLRPWLKQNTVFLEIGAGDCALSFEVAKLVNKAIALDVSETISKSENRPENFELVLSDGVNVPVSGVDVAYSNQLMEHIHPDDAREQLQNVYHALAPGGMYMCVTPNRLTGPHDVSRNFDAVATGFHLKEYTIAELNRLFSEMFRRVTYIPKSDGKEYPVGLAIAYEFMCSLIPLGLRRRLPLPLVLVAYK